MVGSQIYLNDGILKVWEEKEKKKKEEKKKIIKNKKLSS